MHTELCIVHAIREFVDEFELRDKNVLLDTIQIWRVDHKMKTTESCCYSISMCGDYYLVRPIPSIKYQEYVITYCKVVEGYKCRLSLS